MNAKQLAGCLAVAFWTGALFAADPAELALIPRPQTVAIQSGTFRLTTDTRITFASGGEAEAQLLATTLRRVTGFKLPVTPISTRPGKSEITFLLQTNLSEQLGAEGYELSVTNQLVSLRAPTTAGLFYGAQTLLQLLPPQIFSTNQVKGVDWHSPNVQIRDWPRFKWRGMMLDVSRHFYSKQEVKTLLDALAARKINTFHWHLVDDQGWRIEIKKHPKLTEVGAWRDGIGFGLNATNTTAYGKDGRYGGFYTQDDIREVVAYAAARHITIVPEIEMPGHASAALLAYPEFLCPGMTLREMPNKGGVFRGIYCAGNEATFSFLDDVLTEVAALFPGKLIHIGGDECPKDNWKQCASCQVRLKAEGLKNEHELQSYFIRRAEQILNRHGKNLIGWSEIREGGLAPSAALMDWIGGGAESAANGHDVVMVPHQICYFDYYQSTNHTTEPRAIGGFVPLEKVYSFEPVPPTLAPEFHHHILGAQANVWTEYIPNLAHLQYMMFPRMSALAEVNWSAKDARNLEDFKRRLKTDNQRLEQGGINYRRETAN